jgi:hypothetical protein
MLDRRGKLAVLRDLQSQGLEKNAKERPASKKGTVAEKMLVELLEATGAMVVEAAYEKGKE